MRRRWLFTALCACASVGFALPTQAQQQDRPYQLDLLEPFVGHFRVVTEGAKPGEEMEMVGQWILNRSFVRTTSRDKNRTDDGMMILYTYDKENNQFQRWFFFDNSGAFHETGKWDPKEKTFVFQRTDPKTGNVNQSTVKIVDANTKKWTLEIPDPNEPAKAPSKVTGTTTKIQ